MALVFDNSFWLRANLRKQEDCKSKLRAAMNPGVVPSAELDTWFEATFAYATGPLGLSDCATIARYFNIVSLEPKWSANPLHAAYVEAMLNDPYDAIAYEDGVMAVHQNIIEQHYSATSAT